MSKPTQAEIMLALKPVTAFMCFHGLTSLNLSISPEDKVSAQFRCTPPPRSCLLCGCTDEQACLVGCSWIVQFKHGNAGVCSECWDQFTASVRALDAKLI